MKVQEFKTEITVVFLLLLLFLVSSYFSQVYLEELAQLLKGNMFSGALVYVVGGTLTTVIAPLSFFPLLPVVVSLWGSFVAALLSIIAWSLGSAIAFLLARRYGRPLVRQLVGEKKMDYVAEFFPQKHIFLAVVFLRIALPVDLLSYVLGLVGVIRFWPYMAATVIGLIPFAFSFAYLASLNTMWQIAALIVGVLIIVVSFPYLRKQYKKRFQNLSES